MISLLIYVLVLAIVFGLVFYCLDKVSLPAPWAMIARVVVVVIAILCLLNLIVPLTNVGVPVWR